MKKFKPNKITTFMFAMIEILSPFSVGIPLMMLLLEKDTYTPNDILIFFPKFLLILVLFLVFCCLLNLVTFPFTKYTVFLFEDHFSCRDTKVKYDDIKEIFVEYDFISGAMVVLNLEKKTNSPCHKCADYAEICKKDNIKNTIFISGISKKDLDALLKGCSCKKKVISNATMG